MDISVYKYTFFIVSIVLFVLSIITIFFAKKNYLRLYGGAFACLTCSGLLLSFQSEDSIVISTILGNAIFLLGNMFLYNGTRAYFKYTIFPKRLFIILGITIIGVIYTSAIDYNLLARSVLLGIMAIIFYGDFFFFVKSQDTSLQPKTKLGLLSIIVLILSLYLLRIIIIFVNLSSSQFVVNNDIVSIFIFASTTVGFFTWVGLIIYMYNDEKIVEVIQSSGKFHLIAENTSDVVWVRNVNKGEMVYVSPSVKKVFGYTQEEYLSLKLEQMFPEDSLNRIIDGIDEALIKCQENNGYYSPVIFQLQQLCKSGELIWIEFSTEYHHNERGEVEIYGISRNVEERKRSEEQILHLSYHDQLTGLYNRHYLQKVIDEEIDGPYSCKRVYSVVSFDIDNFKLVNDNFGHPVGDTILMEISELVQSKIRKTDMLFRMGGEEFLIIFYDADTKDTFRIVEDIRIAISKTEFHMHVFLTCSFGIAQKNNNEEFDQLYIRADNALFEAKRSGRNKSVCSK